MAFSTPQATRAGRAPANVCINYLLPSASWERVGPEPTVLSTAGIHYTPAILFFFVNCDSNICCISLVA